MIRYFLFVAGAATALLLAPACGSACTVPVFRYAFERFEVDPHQFIVYHRGPLSAEAQSAIDAAKKLADDEVMPVPLVVRVIDLNQLEESVKKTAEKVKAEDVPPKPWMPAADAKLPWLNLIPAGGRPELAAWSGPLQDADLPALVDSPVRRELLRRLFAGDSAVFLLLECGDAAQDDAAQKTIEKTCEEIAKTKKLADDVEDQTRSPIPVRIAFSVLRVKRTDHAERGLVHLLLHMGGNLTDVKGPIAFPVFGRGHVFTAIFGEDISPDAIGEIVTFICGDCSCTIKRQLPGIDLLMAANWDVMFDEEKVSAPQTAPLASLGAVAEAVGSANRPTSEPPLDLPPEAKPDPSGPLAWAIGASIGALIVFAILGSLFVRRMGRGGPSQ